MIKEDLFDYDAVKAAVEKAGYRFFTGEMNINLIGVRTSNRKVNNFDDFLVIAYQENGENKVVVFDQFTTDPGIYYMTKKLLNPKGCAILTEGQHRGMFRIGQHRGYQALQQNSPVKLYRDRNMDDIMDMDPKSVYIAPVGTGINLHHAYDAKVVGLNSAGCQVLRRKKDLATVLDLCKKSAAIYGNSFTYTLLHENRF